MSTINKDRDILTLINVFHVKPENQEELLDLLIEATENTMQHIEGGISANFHKSLDGKRVVNYAQWENPEHWEAMMENPEANEHIQRAKELVESYDPILSEVVYVHEDW